LLPFFVAQKESYELGQEDIIRTNTRPLKTLYERILDRWKEPEADYAKVNNNRHTINALFRPDELLETDDKNGLLGQDIYNGSGAWYSRVMATGFQGLSVSKSIVWIRYQMRQFELRGVDELDLWTQDIKEHMASVYHRSNFYDVQPQFTLDGITTGGPVMFGEEDIVSGRTMWQPQHYTNVRSYYDKFNQIEGVIIQDKTWTAKQIFDTFIGQDDDKGTKRTKKLSKEVNNALKSGKLNDVFTVYRAVFRATDPIWNGWDKPKGQWTWYSVYFLEITESDDEKKNTPLNENIGYFSRPFATWDFDKKPWETVSRTPSFYAIWDCMGLQQVQKNYLENIQLRNRMPVFALNTMKNRLALSAEGEMLVTAAEYDRPPKQLDLIGDVQLSKELSDLYEDALKRWFYVDRFQMFTDLIRMNKQPVTATQIWQMAGEKSTLLSPAIETHSRYLESCDERMISIEWAAGRGPFNRERLGEITDIVVSNAKEPVDSIGIMPVFIGALAQAQKRNQALEPIQSGITAISGLIQLYPDLAMAIREYDTLEDILEAVDFPQKNIVPKDEYEEAIAIINQQRQQQQQFENTIEAAKASKDVSGSVEPDSVLGSLAGAEG